MAGLKIHVMKTVSEGTKEIIIRRARMDGLRELFQTHAALALCNGNVCDLIYASDLAQKTSEVEVFEISGNCPPAPDLPGDSGERRGCGRGGRENTKRTGRLKKPPGADDKEG